MRSNSGVAKKIWILILLFMEFIFLIGCTMNTESVSPGSSEDEFFSCVDDTYYLLQNMPRTAMLGEKTYTIIAGNFIENTAALLLGPENNPDVWQSVTVERNSQLQMDGHIITVIEIGQQSDGENYMTICIE